MRVSFPSLLAALVLVSEASAIALSSPGSAHHARIARRAARKAKRCIQPAPQPSNSGNTDNNNNNNNGGNSGNSGNNGGNTGGSPPPSNSGGSIYAPGGACGDPNPSPVPTVDNGPNGAQEWLNCGIRGGGWVPPPITLQNVVVKSLDEALNMPGNPFGNCGQHLGTFNAIAGQTGIPAILLASIAMQESSCNQWAVGPNGEIGLMQITPDKCPSDGRDCFEPGTNIGIGGWYFKTRIDESNGNLAEALGGYNGWVRGMTEWSANNKGSCGARNNLDYLQNVLNGFGQGIDPSSIQMGTFKNLLYC